MLDKIEEEELESPHEGLENNNVPSRAVHERAYKEAIQETLQKLDREKYLHLVVDDKLQTYSPKYNMIVKSINSKRGSSFVYTEYRTLEGIGVFSKVLEANNFVEFKIEKDVHGDWRIKEDRAFEEGKSRYAFWSGDETSGFLLKIFNNQHNSLPASLKRDLQNLYSKYGSTLDSGDKNIYGDIIKVILTTKKGAEGISLMNIRQVHIIEPYWNPVRLEQVKKEL